ncbi:MAG: hypothetical protein Fur0034_05630 [Desulfuromonadia bacterium]
MEGTNTMKTRPSIAFVLLFFPIGILFLIPETSSAIPAFSREHKAECTTCHTLFPELNEYGEAFLKKGFLLARKENAPVGNKGGSATEPPVVGEGDPELLALLKEGSTLDEKSLEPSADPASPKGKGGGDEALWITGLPRTLPLSLSATLNAAYYNDPPERNKLDFSSRALSLLAGGIFRDKIGFYAKYNLYIQGKDDLLQSQTPLNSDLKPSQDIEEMYVVWRHLNDSPVNVKLGRIRPKLSLWKKSNRAISSGNGATGYQVGRSTFSPEEPQDGVEANAILKERIFVAAGVVDRNQQNNKEGYVHLSFKIGGTDFNGKEPDVDLDNESIWDYLSVILGGFGYVGKNSDGVSPVWNDFYRAGGEVEIAYKNSRFRTTAVFGTDDNPYYDSWANGPYDSKGISAEFEQLFGVYLMGVLHFDYIDNGTEIEHRYVPAIAYTPIENTKITLEYQQSRKDSVDHKVLASLRFAF